MPCGYLRYIVVALFGQLLPYLVYFGNYGVFVHFNLQFPPIISSGVQTTGQGAIEPPGTIGIESKSNRLRKAFVASLVRRQML